MVNEELQYCTHCGAVNKKSAFVCIDCGKKIITKYRPFYDFLKKRIKDEAAGKITDSLFSLIKKFLFSHAYGVLISVSIVASVTATVYSIPDIPTVSEKKTASVSAQQIGETEEIIETVPLSDDDFYTFDHIISNYDGFVETLRSSDAYWGQSGDYNSASELYAENNIEGFSFGGVHEMIGNPIDMYSLDYDSDMMDNYQSFYSDRYFDESSFVTGDACSTDIAKRLISEGYRVAEGNYILKELAGEYDYDTHRGSGAEKKLVYRVVFVEHGGEWYMAEDRLIERKGF